MRVYLKECWKVLIDKFKNYIKILSLDQLNDSNRIIKFIGFIFIFLGGLSFSNKIILSNLTISSIALSGIFFISAEFFKYYSNEVDLKKNIPNTIKLKKKEKLEFTKVIFHFLAILTLIIGPYINLNPNTLFFDKLSNSLSLIAIGLTVLKVGMDNSKKKQDNELGMLEEFNLVIDALTKESTEKKENID